MSPGTCPERLEADLRDISEIPGPGLYLAGYQSQARVFQRYDPGPNTLTDLADAPSVPDLSTITIMLSR